ncbi:hypothetical protein GNX18_18580 [Microbulbifer sp. SH-1]|uniref:hypothetical protein n=1 Tax=Microbulbifer sp. SH-1 TaxID=2681547 RepID=UPI00140A1314|nr:hypothetical protein [Microbulbifer sp. SH-1]QIL91562.1 hypothetical protein GNX18_18580 [Microbulbifer sp. SH-1]
MQRYRQTNLVRFLPLILLCSFALGAQAQSAADDAKTDQEKQEEKVSAQPASVSTKKPTATIKAQSAQSADNYEATEEISEDLSVSYPVDI